MMIPARLAFQSVIRSLKNKLGYFKMMPDIFLFQVDSEEKAKKLLSPEDEIVVYCSGPSCMSSIYAYNLLAKAGFTNIRRFAGGIEEWEDAGYPLEGDSVD